MERPLSRGAALMVLFRFSALASYSRVALEAAAERGRILDNGFILICADCRVGRAA